MGLTAANARGTMPLRVLLADDHHLVRAGIRALVTSFNNYQVVAEAGDGVEALQLLRQHKPDIALLDIAMPGLNGLEVTAAIKKEHPAIQVVILSMHSSEVYVTRALH